MSTQLSLNLWELEWTFGDRLRKARRVLGLSLEDVAATLNVSKQAVSNMETRPNTPKAAHTIAKRIELAYGIPSWWMLGKDQDPGPGTWAPWESNPQPAVSPYPLTAAA